VLRQADLELAAVDAFAVSIGPGSFTGLRVGVATLKGLAFGSEKPVAAVSTLAVLAQAAASGAAVAGSLPIVALLDARRGEVYAGGWQLSVPAGAVPVSPPEGVYTPRELAAALPPGGVLLVGEGIAICGEQVRELAGAEVQLGPVCEPRARDVGILGCWKLAAGNALRVEEIVPRYVRRAEAEVQRTGHRFE
jgi:tRNA threonylcarbamoyladenosine biosynthesis protein TsaB